MLAEQAIESPAPTVTAGGYAALLTAEAVERVASNERLITQEQGVEQPKAVRLVLSRCQPVPAVVHTTGADSKVLRRAVVAPPVGDDRREVHGARGLLDLEAVSAAANR